eukprot:749659-Amphidinium_carterae.1
MEGAIWIKRCATKGKGVSVFKLKQTLFSQPSPQRYSAGSLNARLTFLSRQRGKSSPLATIQLRHKLSQIVDHGSIEQAPVEDRV